MNTENGLDGQQTNIFALPLSVVIIIAVGCANKCFKIYLHTSKKRELSAPIVKMFAQSILPTFVVLTFHTIKKKAIEDALMLRK